jgi:hypothetical protein
MHFARANGPVALSSLGAYLMLCSNELLILYYLVSNIYLVMNYFKINEDDLKKQLMNNYGFKLDFKSN